MVDQKTADEANDNLSSKKVVIKSCLYVSEDDSSESVAVISKQLEDMGYKVVRASDVSSAKNMCQMNFFSLIVLEGCKDGDFIRTIKCKNSCNEQTPVLFIAAGSLPDMIKELMQDQFLDEVVFKCSTLESDLSKAVEQLTTQQGNFAITPRSKRTESAVKKKKPFNVKTEDSNDAMTVGSYLNLQPADLQTAHMSFNEESSWLQEPSNNTSQILQTQAFNNYYGPQVLPNYHVPVNAAYQPVPLSGGLTNLNPVTFTLDGTALHAITTGAAEYPNYMWPGTAPLSAMALQPFASSLAPELNYELKPQKNPTMDDAAAVSAFWQNVDENASSGVVTSSEDKNQNSTNAAVSKQDENEIKQSPTKYEKEYGGTLFPTSTMKQQKICENKVEEIDSNTNKGGTISTRAASTSDSRKRKSISNQEKINRKKAHLDLEKKRRERITKCWHWLRQIIPFCDQSADKATVFEMTVAYIYHCWKYHSDILPDICKEFELAYATSGLPDDLDDMVEAALKQEGKCKAPL